MIKKTKYIPFHTYPVPIRTQFVILLRHVLQKGRFATQKQLFFGGGGDQFALVRCSAFSERYFVPNRHNYKELLPGTEVQHFDNMPHVLTE